MSGEIIQLTVNSNLAKAGEQSPVLAYLASLSSPASRRTMLSALNGIAALATSGRGDAGGFPWHTLTPGQTAALRTALIETGGKPATINKSLAALRGVLRACWRLGLIDTDTYQRTADIPSVKSSTLPRGRALSRAEIVALFAACDQTIIAGRRDAAMLALLYGCGLRRAEVIGLNVEDYDPAEGAIVVRGKGRKERMVYLPAGARAALDAWLEVHPTGNGPLLIAVQKGQQFDQTGRRLTTQAIYGRLKTIAKRAGIRDFSPHDLRRSYVSDLLEAGADASLVQQLAGHSDVRTTLRYDRRPEDAKRGAAGLLHIPR